MKIESHNNYAFLFVFTWVLGAVFLFVKEYRKYFNLILVICGIIGLIVAELTMNVFSLQKATCFEPIVQLPLVSIFVGIIFYFPKMKFLQKLGNLSYTLYIIHFPILLFIFSIFHRYSFNSPILLILLFILSITFVAYLAFWLSKFLENKNFFYNLLKKHF